MPSRWRRSSPDEGRHGWRARGGVISDTHGLIRPQALAALRGSEHIVHAGDLGLPAVLDALSAIAPVTAIPGNNDRDAWSHALRDTATLEVDGVRFYVLHDVHALDLEPHAAGFAAVIAGHTHKPAIEARQGVLFVNPGSAGPRRFTLPVALAVIRRILTHLGLPTEASAPRPPPSELFDWS